MVAFGIQCSFSCVVYGVGGDLQLTQGKLIVVQGSCQAAVW